ncbi:ParB/RepB/Spo0J family partition protein [Frisingicoccus sp.]|uniref:ParB/RepB/Spo0J family partition protein n=1 Tax=Frisingicoccus sp. TaxID=1918627 RepID=UPI003AB7C30D
MGKFGFNDILNAKSRAAGAGTVSEYTEIWLSPYEVKPSESNFYSQENIEELADSFLAVGQQQPTVLGRVNGEFRIVSGHRRNLANIMNIERGHEEYNKVRYLYKDMSAAMFELSLLIGNAYNRELTAWEKTQQAQKLKEALLRAKKEDGLEITGKLRDIIADLLNESSTNVARMDAINNNATPEVKEALKNGNIGITAAYEAAKLPEEEQREIAAAAAAGESVRAKEIAAKVAEKKAGDDYETPHPESITSLCYSCQKYKECNVKTGTCEKCDQYVNKAEAEKTDEQRYNEEQDKIDRETKRKLQERADAEKMDKLPSERGTEHKRHEVKIAASYYDDVASGKKRFELRKNDRGYKEGDSLKMLEFKDGKHTGRTIDADIIYMLEEYTGLQEGYCILGIDVTGHSGEVSETDTGGQLPGQMSIDDYQFMNKPEREASA